VKGTLGDIASRAGDVAAPAVIVIGEVVGLASLIAPPLATVRVADFSAPP
jgi:siroheme synthase